MPDYQQVENYMLARLEKELDESFYYHNADHTRDVIRAARELTRLEGTDPALSAIIMTAALFHDAGMLTRYQEHEEESAGMAGDILPRYGYKPDEIKKINQLILATKAPRNPKSPEEMILCDADMDGLGREDFFISSLRLQLEWKVKGILETTLTEWFRFQVKFLEEHRYFCRSAVRLRQEGKKLNLDAVKNLLTN